MEGVEYLVNAIALEVGIFRDASEPKLHSRPVHAKMRNTKQIIPHQP